MKKKTKFQSELEQTQSRGDEVMKWNSVLPPWGKKSGKKNDPSSYFQWLGKNVKGRFWIRFREKDIPAWSLLNTEQTFCFLYWLSLTFQCNFLGRSSHCDLLTYRCGAGFTDNAAPNMREAATKLIQVYLHNFLNSCINLNFLLLDVNTPISRVLPDLS